MNKCQILKVVSEHSGVPRSTVKEICEGFLYAIAEDLAAGNKVKLAGFGSFHVKTWGGDISQHTGKDVPLKHICKFTPGKTMRAASRFVGYLSQKCKDDHGVGEGY